MEILDTAEGRGANPAEHEGHSSTDRFEMTRVFSQREEEEKVEAAMALYEKAARARMPDGVPEAPDSAESEEEREERSQRLKLQQKCQDIAAWILADELEEELDGEEPNERNKEA